MTIGSTSEVAPAVVPGSGRRPRAVALGAVGLSTASIALLLLKTSSLPVGLGLLMVAVPLVAWLVVLDRERRGEVMDVRALILPIGALLLLAVALEPTGSRDIWSYTMYGRIISAHGASPYIRLPADYPHDPFLHLVAHGWRHTTSVYGPVFVVLSAMGTAIAGPSVLLARLYQQIGAAVAVAVVLSLVWRRTKSPAAVMLLGLNPLVIVTIVNGGHNDALVGLGVLAAVLFAEQDRPVGAGMALAIAALVKVTALLALPVLVGWVFARYGRRAAGQLAGVAIAAVLVVYAAFGPSALSALDANRNLMSRASPWQIVRTLLRLQSDHSFAGLPRATWLAAFGLGSILVVGSLALLVAWHRRRDRELGTGVALALAAYLVAGIYALPWYAMWMLPSAALSRRKTMLVFVGGLCAFLEAVYVVKDRANPFFAGWGWWWLGAYIGPAIVVGVYLVIAFRTPVDGTATDHPGLPVGEAGR
jgi:alpha-1,6-mannosyltransferase